MALPGWEGAGWWAAVARDCPLVCGRLLGRRALGWQCCMGWGGTVVPAFLPCPAASSMCQQLWVCTDRERDRATSGKCRSHRPAAPAGLPLPEERGWEMEDGQPGEAALEAVLPSLHQPWVQGVE